MSQKKEIHIPLHAPNIVNVCVDKDDHGEIAGRIYHCYDKEPWHFKNVIGMVELMEDFFDRISFPQASTQTRVFANAAKQRTEILTKVATPKEIAENQGERGTFLICVKYRQNSSWQGEVEWLEQGVVQHFISVLELLKILNNALG